MAGVSASTVSNAWNGRTQAMTGETLQRVEEAIRALHYRPSSVARGLVTKCMGTIGLVINEIETPLFLQGLSVLEPLARRTGYNVLLCVARTAEDEREAVDLLLEKQVEGIIFLSTSQYVDDDYLLDLQLAALPSVLINRATTHAGFDQIHWDNRGGIISAVGHLVRLGHRRIAHLRGPMSRRCSVERLEGYRFAHQQHGLPCCEDLIRPGDFAGRPETWEQSVIELLGLPEPPTAIIASDDVVAARVMKTIQNCGLRVPQDVAVVGIDNQPFSACLNPSLTTIQLPVITAGKRAIEMLLDRIAGERKAVQSILLSCPLIVRESCGAAVSADRPERRANYETD